MMAFARMFNKHNENFIHFLAYNEKNAKFVRGSVTNKKSLEDFDLVWNRLKQIPSDSEEADYLVAGMAVRAMTWQDFSDGTTLYPQVQFTNAHRTCFGELDPPYSTPEEKLAVLEKWGRCALINKTLGFDGKMPIFDSADFLAKLNNTESSSFKKLTDRFDKYQLVYEQDEITAFSFDAS